MASALERGAEELLHDGCCGGSVDESSRHYEYVGIVVQADKVGYFGYPAQSGTYPLMLVERHADTLTAATDGYAWIALSAFHSFSQRVTVVGIITTVG